jgi:hypothetical protein
MQAEPDDDLVLQTIEAGGAASADDICAHLKTLWLKGHKPGMAKGPRSFGWFVAPGSTSAIYARRKMSG